MMNENNISLLKLQRENLNKIVNLQHLKTMEEISLENERINAETAQ